MSFSKQNIRGGESIMLIIIILAALVLIGVALLVVAKIIDDFESGYGVLGGFGIGLTIIPGFVLLVCGIVCIAANTQVAKTERAVELDVTVHKLKARQFTIYQALTGDLNLPVQDTGREYHVIIDNPLATSDIIYEYNCEVIDFKKDLYMDKIMSESPWLNWFINPGFKDAEGYNDSATNYKDILGDTLKTFEFVRKE